MLHFSPILYFFIWSLFVIFGGKVVPQSMRLVLRNILNPHANPFLLWKLPSSEIRCRVFAVEFYQPLVGPSYLNLYGIREKGGEFLKKKTSLNLNQTTRCHVSDHDSLHGHHREKPNLARLCPFVTELPPSTKFVSTLFYATSFRIWDYSKTPNN